MKNKKILINIIKSIAFISAGAYIVAVCLIYAFQGDYIYFPQDISQRSRDNIATKGNTVKAVEMTMKDGIKVKGWYIPSKTKPDENMLIYFGGNADELSNSIDSLGKYNDWSIVLINYRGYGDSEGTPSEKNLFNDSLAIYDKFVVKGKTKNVVVMGRSLGTGVATYLAENRKVDSVVLTTPYDSMLSIAKEQMPKIIPVGLMLRDRFNSLDRARHINVPVLMLLASNDEVIGRAHSERLSNAWAGAVDKKIIPETTHNSICYDRKYWSYVDIFLKNILKK